MERGVGGADSEGAKVKVVGARNLVLVVEPYAGSGVSLAMPAEDEGVSSPG